MNRSITNLLISIVLLIQFIILEYPSLFIKGSFEICLTIAMLLSFQKITKKYTDIISILYFINQSIIFCVYSYPYLKYLEIVIIVLMFVQFMVLYLFRSYDFPPTTGEYLVGYREFTLKKGEKNIPVAIFYPTNEKTKDIPWMVEDYMEILIDASFHTNFNSFIKSIIRMMFNFMYSIDLGVNFESNLIDQNIYKTVIFSHGLGGNRHGYSVFSRELASKGYIVFCTDHKEKIIILENMKNLYKELPRLKHERWVQLQSRMETVSLLLDFIYEAEKVDKIFGKSVKLNYEKLSILGHSFGAITSFYSMFKEKERIKGGVIGLDPYMFPLSDEYLEKKLNIPFLSICTESFNDAIKYAKNNTNITKLCNNNENKNKLRLCIKESSHLHQCDFVFFFPIATRLLGFLTKHGDPFEIIRVNQALIEMFLEKIIHNNENIENFEKEINDIEYKGKKIGKKYVMRNPDD